MHAAPTATPPLASYELPNACWSTDFKGNFRTGDGVECFPLTMQDVATRYLLRCQALYSTAEAPARAVFAAAFREYGMPAFMRSDNGTPFSAVSFSGLSALSAWWVSLDIGVDRIPPAQPQHNGRIERMHRTLKAETTKPPARNLLGQQRKFNSFQGEYNEERPHEALANETPATRYQPSTRVFPRIAPEPRYPERWQQRLVNENGTVGFAAHRLASSSADTDSASKASTTGSGTCTSSVVVSANSTSTTERSPSQAESASVRDNSPGTSPTRSAHAIRLP